MQHLHPPPRLHPANNPLYHLPHPLHMQFPFTRIKNDAASRIIQEIPQRATRVGPIKEAFEMRHVDPVSRVGGLVGGPGGQGAPVVVFGDLGAEEEVAFADHVPDDVDGFEAAVEGGEVNVGCVEEGAQSLGGCEEVGGGEEAVAAAAELGGDEGGVGDVGDDVVVGEGDVGFLCGVDEIRAKVTLLEWAEVAFGVGAVVGARVGAADEVFLFDDGEEGGVVSCVDRMGEVVVGILDEDGAGDVVFLYYRSHRVNDISSLLLGVEEFKFAAFVGS